MIKSDFATRLQIVEYIDETFEKNKGKRYDFYNFKTEKESVSNGSIDDILDRLFSQTSDYELYIPILDMRLYSKTIKLDILDDILKRMEEKGIK